MTSSLEKRNVQHPWTSCGMPAYFSSLYELRGKVVWHTGCLAFKGQMTAFLKYNWVATCIHFNSSFRTGVTWSYLHFWSRIEQRSSGYFVIYLHYTLTCSPIRSKNKKSLLRTKVRLINFDWDKTCRRRQFW